MPGKYMVLVLLTFGFSNSALSQNKCLADRSGFVRVCNGKLYLDGKEYREIGFNFYKVFRKYLGWDCEGASGCKESAKKDLRILAEHGFRVIRVMGPFGPSEFYEVFFDDNPKIQERKRQKYLAALDEFLDDSSHLDIWVVFSLNWNLQNLADLGHHSLREGLTNPDSLGHKRFKEYTEVIVRHLLGRPKVILENGNEYNLAADLKSSSGFAENGVISHSPEGIGYIYRGSENNFTSYELASFLIRTTALIKSIDPKRLVVTGNAEPPDNAMGRLRSAIIGKQAVNSMDTPVESETMIRLLEGSADLMASHYYINEKIGVGWYQNLARRLGKPLFMGEVGPHFWDSNRTLDPVLVNYNNPNVIKDVRRKSKDIVDAGVAISLWWTYDCDDGDPAFKLCYGKTDEALKIIENSNKKLKKRR